MIKNEKLMSIVAEEIIHHDPINDIVLAENMNSYYSKIIHEILVRLNKDDRVRIVIKPTDEVEVNRDNKGNKIICSDNFNRDEVSDSLVADNVNIEVEKIIIDYLDSRTGDNSYNFYRLVEDSHELYVFEY